MNWRRWEQRRLQTPRRRPVPRGKGEGRDEGVATLGVAAILGEGSGLAIVRARRLGHGGDRALGVRQRVARLPLLEQNERAVSQQAFVLVGHAKGVGERVLTPPPTPLVGSLV